MIAFLIHSDGLGKNMDAEPKKLLETFDGELEFAINSIDSINQAIEFYFPIARGSLYDKRLEQELQAIFAEKISNKAYFHSGSREWKLKALGFNQILHILMRRLWDEEDFELIAKIPAKIAFLDNNQDIYQARVTEKDAHRYITNLRILPFITPYPDFFKLSVRDQIHKTRAWVLQNEGKLRYCLERIRLIGAYIQTLSLAGQHLISLANDYEKNGPSALGDSFDLEEKIQDTGKILEERAEIFTAIIMKQKEINQRLFIFTEPVLKRSLYTNFPHLLKKEARLKDYTVFFQEFRNKNRPLSEVKYLQFVKAIVFEFFKTVFHEELDFSRVAVQHTDYVFVIDLIMHIIRIISQVTEPETIQENITSLTQYVQTMVPTIEEKHIKLAFILYRESQNKISNPITEEDEQFFQKLAEKLDIFQPDVKLIYLLIQSDHGEALSRPLADFMKDCIQEDKDGILNDSYIQVLKSLFSNLPGEIKARQFYTIKERIKSRYPQDKRKLVDNMTHFIEQKIREHRLEYVQQFMDFSNEIK